MSSLIINTLQGCGAEVSGVDLRQVTENEFDKIRQAFSEHGLLFFLGQELSELDHIQFAEKWGKININRFFTAHENHPQLAMVTKEPEQDVNIGGGWHTDHSYDFEPALGSILVARELPATGGDTWFCNMYKAYDGLSEGLKETLLGLRAVHSARHVFGSVNADYEKASSGRITNSGAADVLADPVHPVVVKHPLSGKLCLYVNSAFTLRFEGWTAEESAPLLAYLYEQAPSEANVTKFKWQPGSVAFWDNRATWHYALNDYQGQRREMHRITIEGCALG